MPSPTAPSAIQGITVGLPKSGSLPDREFDHQQQEREPRRRRNDHLENDTGDEKSAHLVGNRGNNRPKSPDA